MCPGLHSAQDEIKFRKLSMTIHAKTFCRTKYVTSTKCDNHNGTYCNLKSWLIPDLMWSKIQGIVYILPDLVNPETPPRHTVDTCSMLCESRLGTLKQVVD